MKIETPGKLILIGEYAVLEGAAALVTAVNRYAKIEIKNSQSQSWVFESPTFGISNLKFNITASGKIQFAQPLSQHVQDKLNFFSKALEYFTNKYGKHLSFKPKRVVLNTDDFFIKEKNDKLGLGSSAALVVALIVGFKLTLDQPEEETLDTHKIFVDALMAHYFAQGKMGSGIDIAASTFGGIAEYHMNNILDKHEPDIIPRKIPNNLYILTIWSGKSASTRELVKKIKNLKQEHPSKFQAVMEPLKETSTNGCNYFADGNISLFLKLCDQFYHNLMHLGEVAGANIISDIHQQIAKIVQRAGGVYKPSGAGGGDIGIALTDSQSVADRISDNILRSEFEIVNLSPVKKGIVIENIQ